jgi:hypothetical protein
MTTDTLVMFVVFGIAGTIRFHPEALKDGLGPLRPSDCSDYRGSSDGDPCLPSRLHTSTKGRTYRARE